MLSFYKNHMILIVLFFQLSLLFVTVMNGQEKFLLTSSEMTGYELERQTEFGWEINKNAQLHKVIQQKWKGNDTLFVFIEYGEFKDGPTALGGTAFAATKSFATPYIFGSFDGSIIKDASWIPFDHNSKYLFFVRGNVGIKLGIPLSFTKTDQQNLILKLLNKIELNLSPEVLAYEESIRPKQISSNDYQTITEPVVISNKMTNFSEITFWNSKWLLDSTNMRLGIRKEWKNDQGVVLGIDICKYDNDLEANIASNFRNSHSFFYDILFSLENKDSLTKIIERWIEWGPKDNISVLGVKKNLTIQIYEYNPNGIDTNLFLSIVEDLVEQVSNF